MAQGQFVSAGEVRPGDVLAKVTGRGWYSEPCEYQHDHVRVRVNPGGIIILRDPGCRLQITRPASRESGADYDFINPNMRRIDATERENMAYMQRAVESFESRPAFTADEARAYFWGETPCD